MSSTPRRCGRRIRASCPPSPTGLIRSPTASARSPSRAAGRRRSGPAINRSPGTGTARSSPSAARTATSSTPSAPQEGRSGGSALCHDRSRSSRSSRHRERPSGEPRLARSSRRASYGAASLIGRGTVGSWGLPRERLGFAQLRAGQLQAAVAATDGRDVLAVLPTGGGKSAIYELAGMLREGPTVVVSPLIALQDDQLAHLRAAGLPAIVLNSHQS